MDTVQLGLLEYHAIPAKNVVIQKAATLSIIDSLKQPQLEIVESAYIKVANGYKKILLVALMGVGKTILAGWIIRDAVKASKECVFFVHFDTLVNQTVEEFSRLGLTANVLQGNKKFNKHSCVAVVSIQSLESKLKKGASVSDILGHRDVLFFDECHELAFRESFDLIDKHYPDAIKFGLTATPWRLSKKEWLGQKFETTVEGWQPPKLIKEGISVHARCYAIGGGVIHVTEADVGFDGDYSEGLMGKQASEDAALEYTFQEWQRLSGDRPTIMVGSTIEQAKATTAKFLEHGIPTEMVIGSTSKKQRKDIFARVACGQTQVITSVGALVAGFNLPILSSILFVRATKSKSLFFQCCGRPARSYPGKEDYLILDFGGNLKRFGNPMDFQDYSIDGEMPEDNGESFKDCPNCGHTQRVFNSKCEKCGYEFNSPEEEIEEETHYQELVEYTNGLTKQKIKNIRAWRKMAFKQWSINRQASDTTSPDRAIQLFLDEYGHNPPADWIINSALTRRYSKSKLRDYIAYLKAHIKNPKYAKGWLNYHYRLETGQDIPDNQLDLLLRDV
ncbi:MAG: DEAD/DEAH box helicase family protein [Nodosilinea sp. WJT8-NPBG4]|jgi:superfamily II DNA or RNA helicase|nr:DEAD/DEAH box helicase family protein [Nodosilinea sp. WJT8-NPBG4]